MKIQKEFQNTNLVHRIESIEEEELLRLLKIKPLGSYSDINSEDRDWEQLGLREISKDWDNEADSVYDNWREHYDVSKG